MKRQLGIGVAEGSCRHHPSEDCGCYCRFVGCSPETCPVDAHPESETARCALEMLGVEMREATEDEQREALERELVRRGWGEK